MTLTTATMAAHSHAPQGVAGPGAANSPAGAVWAEAHIGRGVELIYATSGGTAADERTGAHGNRRGPAAQQPAAVPRRSTSSSPCRASFRPATEWRHRTQGRCDRGASVSRACARSSAAGVALALVAGLQVALLATPASAATTFNVTTTADIAANAGACGNPAILTAPNPASLSLREAVCLANNNGGTATVNIPAGTYTLTNGELQVGMHSGQNVTLSGAGAATTIIDAGGAQPGARLRPEHRRRRRRHGQRPDHQRRQRTARFGGAGIIGGSANASTRRHADRHQQHHHRTTRRTPRRRPARTTPAAASSSSAAR